LQQLPAASDTGARRSEIAGRACGRGGGPPAARRRPECGIFPVGGLGRPDGVIECGTLSQDPHGRAERPRGREARGDVARSASGYGSREGRARYASAKQAQARGTRGVVAKGPRGEGARLLRRGCTQGVGGSHFHRSDLMCPSQPHRDEVIGHRLTESSPPPPCSLVPRCGVWRL